MVLKRGKCGLNTGCSLKYGRYKWEYRNIKSCQGIVIKIYLGPEKHRDAMLDDLALYVDDGGIEAQRVYGPPSSVYDDKWDYMYYSLNKHQRWKLPALVKEAIDWKQHLSGKNYGLTLVEREIFPRNFKQVRPESLYMRDWKWTFRCDRVPWFPWKLPDCTGYHDNRNDIKHSYPVKQHSYYGDLGMRGDFKSLHSPISAEAYYYGFLRGDVRKRPRGVRKRGIQRYFQETDTDDVPDPSQQTYPWTVWRWLGASYDCYRPDTEDFCEVRYEVATPRELCARSSLTSGWKSNWNNRVIQTGAGREGDAVRNKRKSLHKMKGMKRRHRRLVKEEIQSNQF